MNVPTKTIQALLLSLVLTVLLVSCGGRSEGCHISGRCTADPYSIAVFSSLGGEVIDSVAIIGERFAFEVDGRIDEPYLNLVILRNPDDAEDYVEIPVGIENGEVRISYGECFRTGGTPLNDKVMVFYSGLSQLRDEVTSPERKVAVDEIPAEFSHYYLRSIGYNTGNPLASYIYDSYGSHLLGDDLAKARQVLNK